MATSRKVQVPWSKIDTLLLDMDGTLLDLAFDNFFWLELVPTQFARLTRLPVTAAKDEIKRRYAEVVGTLPWYCIDHWTRELGLDIRALKRAHSHRICYLPKAREFLRAARQRKKRLILVTNAHRGALEIKAEVTGVDTLMDDVVSSHDYTFAKEQGSFWVQLTQALNIEPARSLLVEDSLPVLATAKAFGIGHSIAIRCPDSGAQRREVIGFDAVDGVADLV